MNNPTVGHLGSASNPINQDRKWTAKKSYPLSASPHHGSLIAHFMQTYLVCCSAIVMMSKLFAGLAAYVLALTVSAFAEG